MDKEIDELLRHGGGPAFPLKTKVRDPNCYPAPGYTEIECFGMTLRDHFAGLALQGILAGGFAETIPHDDINGGYDAAHFAYLYADAMLLIRRGKEQADDAR